MNAAFSMMQIHRRNRVAGLPTRGFTKGGLRNRQPTQSQNSAGDSGAVRPAPKARPLTELSDIADVRSGAAAVSVTGVTLRFAQGHPGRSLLRTAGATSTARSSLGKQSRQDAPRSSLILRVRSSCALRSGTSRSSLPTIRERFLGGICIRCMAILLATSKVVGITGTDGEDNDGDARQKRG